MDIYCDELILGSLLYEVWEFDYERTTIPSVSLPTLVASPDECTATSSCPLPIIFSVHTPLKVTILSHYYFLMIFIILWLISIATNDNHNVVQFMGFQNIYDC